MKGNKLGVFALLAILALLTFACSTGEAELAVVTPPHPILTEQGAKDLLQAHLIELLQESSCKDSLTQEIEESRPYWTADYMPSEQVWEIRAIGYGNQTDVPLIDLRNIKPYFFNIKGIWRVYAGFNRVGSANEYAQYFELVARECQ